MLIIVDMAGTNKQKKLNVSTRKLEKDIDELESFRRKINHIQHLLMRSDQVDQVYR